MMLLLLKLRNRCVVFLGRRDQSTSTQAVQRPSCKHAAITACLSTMSYLGGVFVIVAVIYAANSPHWIDLGARSSDCHEVPSPGSQVTVEAASPRPTTDVRGSSDVRASGMVDPVRTSSNTSGSTEKHRLSRCTTGHEYFGAWTICAIYDTQLHSCGKTKDTSASRPTP